MFDVPHYWIKRDKSNSEDENDNEQSSLNYSRILIKILKNRGISGREQIESFLNPGLADIHDPYLLPNIQKGIDRVKKAIANKEKILVFGDYDTDGIISSVIIYDFLKKLGLEPEAYIPDRFDEGYDLNLETLRKILSRQKYKLIICTDCGTNNHDTQRFIEDSKEVDVITCDHHNPSLDNCSKTDNYIIINPKIKDSVYPFKDLSGAAVSFKFVIALLRSLKESDKNKFDKRYLTSTLDLVAIATIADLMPLIDENRVIVKRGLKMIRDTVNPGLKIMVDNLLKEKKEVSEYDIGFIIAPRLNASGRIENGNASFELLSGESTDCVKIVRELERYNQRRQEIQKNIVLEILRDNDFDNILDNKKVFISKSEEWNEGVLGIVASEIVKQFNIPAILFKEKDGKLKGSGRSTLKFDLFSNLNTVSHFFKRFGGHKQACGISMDIEQFKEFTKEFEAIVSEKIKDADLKKELHYDIEINFDAIDDILISELALLKPYGIGNPRPVFLSRNCNILNFKFLKNGEHIKIDLKNSGKVFNAFIFKVSEEQRNKISENNSINILYNLEENEWRGQSSIRMILIDLF